MESRIIASNRDLEGFSNNDAHHLTAEVFYAELQPITGRDLLDKTVVMTHGMDSRTNSQDITKLQREGVYKDGQLGERLILDPAGNGFYHQLPEFTSHSTFLSLPRMSNREVAEAIRENRKKAEKTIHFLFLFNTMMFHDSIRIFERQLSLSERPSRNAIIKNVTSLFFPKTAPLTVDERHKMFLCPLEVERYKENLSVLEELLSVACAIDAKIQYVYHYEEDPPYISLGDYMLGVDLGLDGQLLCELNDAEVDLCFHDTIKESVLKKQAETVKYVLSFFFISSRDIKIIYIVTTDIELVLEQNYLGYDTSL